jgi:hypothetical protein
MSTTQIKIILTNVDRSSSYTLNFKLFNTPIAKKWLDEIKEFDRNGQPFDDRERFYNFPYSKYTKEYVVAYLNNLIDTINRYSPGLITEQADVNMLQDTLNYLHHIFEVYHGLYDQQGSNKFFNNAPADVKQALADLNIWIHRFESLGDFPRLVGTWYKKPCRKPLADEDFNEFSLKEQWGDLKINYCEVGKTLFDLYHDQDQYIEPEAFKPLAYYSVDFTVRFTNKSKEYYSDLENKVWEYFDEHEEFFHANGYTKFSPKLSLGWITVGRLINQESRDEILNSIGLHQHIKEISLI